MLRPGASVLAAVLAVTLVAAGRAAEVRLLSEDGGFYPSRKMLAAAGAVGRRDRAATASLEKLLVEARAALKHSPQAMREFNVPGYYGKGQKEHIRKKTLLSEDAMAALSCALAYRLGAGSSRAERAAFGAKAVAILDDWASKNRGYSGGDGALVMCYNGVGLVFAAQLMWRERVWPEEGRRAFAEWARTVVRRASGIKKRRNNWACWGILAALAVDHLLQDDAAFRKDVEVLRRIIDRQIEPDGRMPEELRRGERSLWYTYFALAPMTGAIEIVRNSGGPDLYAWQPPSGGTIRDATAFLFERGCRAGGKWPGRKQKTSMRPSSVGGNVMFAMGRVFGVAEWVDWAKPPVWRSSTGLCWVCPTLFAPGEMSPADSERRPGGPSGSTGRGR
ncbi:MAG: alginate lyase family protein [Planctomycetota bacterium]|jgi:hypothetical protein